MDGVGRGEEEKTEAPAGETVLDLRGRDEGDGENLQMVRERGNERGKNKMLRPIKKEEIPQKRRGKKGFYANAIEDFLAQESECCELMREGREKWDARNIRTGLWHAMKRIGTDVDIMVRGNRVFLKKKSKT